VAVVEAAGAPPCRHTDWKVGLQLPIVVVAAVAVVAEEAANIAAVAEQAANTAAAAELHTEREGQRKRKGSGPGRQTLYRNVNAVAVYN